MKKYREIRNILKTYATLLIVLMSLAIVLGCIGTKTTKTTTAPKIGEVIKIGGTLPLSGVSAADGQRFLRGMELAVEKINNDGGVLDAKLKLVILDDGMDATKVSALYETLVTKEKVDILVPSYGAPMTMPALAVAKKYNKLMISGYTSSAGVTEAYGGDVYFSINTQTKDKGYSAWWYSGLTDFLSKFDEWNYKNDVPKPTKIAVLSENQFFGIENHKVWLPIAKSQGWNIVVDEFVDMGQTDFTSILAKIKNEKPDVILCEFYYFRCAMFVKQMREQNITANFIAMSEAGTTSDWVDPEKGVGPELGNGILTYAYLPKTYHEGLSDYFRSKHVEVYGSAFGFLEAAGAAQIEIIAQAIEKAGSLETEDIKNALLNYQFECCYSPVKFDAEGTNELFDPIVAQWIDGKLENIYPLDKSTKRVVYPYKYT